jgi:hemolysin activation/secretion protein
MNAMKIWHPNRNFTFIARGNGAAALSRIPQSQVFQIGGQATVRGTPEALMNGDSGYLISLEGRYRLAGGSSNRDCVPTPCGSVAENFRTDIRKNSRADLFVFCDHGGVFYRERTAGMRQADFLTSIGLGTMLNVGRHLTFTGGFGQPIFTAESHQTNYRTKLQHGSGFFSARCSF